MATTYEPIATTTLGSAAASVTFSSISGSYTDIILVGTGTLATSGTLNIKFNNDTSSLYSRTEVYGDGSAAASYRESNQSTQNFANWDTAGSNFIMQLQNYSNSSVFKTCLTRYNRPSSLIAANVILYRSTTAISNIVITGGYNIQTGSTFTLYGIKSFQHMSDCIKWHLHIHDNGYGQANIKGTSGKHMNAHRWVWIQANGPIPKGMVIDHICHTEAVAKGECAGGLQCKHRSCVNLGHLQLITQQENIIAGLHNIDNRTNCNKGHIFEGNIMVRKNGKRECGECNRARSRANWAKKVAA